MSKREKNSPAWNLLAMVWRHEGAAKGAPSWGRLNHAMASALRLAITFGFRFDLGDFARMAEEFSSHYWLGDPHGERFYELAADPNEAGSRGYGPNVSAARSYEAWRKRRPWILRTARCVSGGRLAVGSRFTWPAGPVPAGPACQLLPELELTSFADDDGDMVACGYTWTEEQYPRKKLARRVRITREQFDSHNRDVSASLKAEKKNASTKNPEDGVTADERG